MDQRVGTDQVDAVDASEIEAQVLREQLKAQQTDEKEPSDAVKSKKTHRKHLLAEINAVKGLLRAQADAAGPSDGGVTEELLRQRVQGLQSTLTEFQVGEDEDAWSSSDEEDVKEAAKAVPETLAGGANGKHKTGEKGKGADAQQDAAALGSAIKETEREKQIRLGLITPFQNLPGFSRGVVRRTGAQPSSGADGEVPFSEAARRKLENTATYLVNAAKQSEANAPKTQLLEASELEEEDLRGVTKTEYFLPKSSTRFGRGPAGDKVAAAAEKEGTKKWRAALVAARPEVPAATPARGKRRRHTEDDALGYDEVEDLEDPVLGHVQHAGDGSDDDRFDDADSDFYEQRLQANGGTNRSVGDAAVRRAVLASSTSQPSSLANSPPASPSAADEAGAKKKDNLVDAEVRKEASVSFDGGLSLPAPLYDRLFPYQQGTSKQVIMAFCEDEEVDAGIMGDEMGLGKTIQLIAFLAGLAHSGMYRTSLVIAPVTTLRHWQRELRQWHPQFRVIVLHNSSRSRNGRSRSVDDLVAKARRSSAGIILMGYEGLRRHADTLLALDWGYVILDEGHRIRNPDAEITLLCKQVRTSHRLIMSGTPIQNRLSELWSLFDFVFPGKLGTLPVFQAQFGTPIQAGTYANATPMVVTAAYKCAVMLRDMISPYLLRRTKVDVAKQLPKKSEQVLFCSLSPPQRQLYQEYLHSQDVADIIEGRRPAMEGITLLRKICNHADLLHRTELQASEEVEYGAIERSSKLQVAMQVLEKWRAAGHKALLFTQTQQMLDILEHHVAAAGMHYLRMDGSVPARTRFRMIDAFNRHPPAGPLPQKPQQQVQLQQQQVQLQQQQVQLQQQHEPRPDAAAPTTAAHEVPSDAAPTALVATIRRTGSNTAAAAEVAEMADADDVNTGKPVAERATTNGEDAAGGDLNASPENLEDDDVVVASGSNAPASGKRRRLAPKRNRDVSADVIPQANTHETAQHSSSPPQLSASSDDQWMHEEGFSEGSAEDSSEDDFDGVNRGARKASGAQDNPHGRSRRKKKRKKSRKGKRTASKHPCSTHSDLDDLQELKDHDENVFVFLLTTRVGGLGVNLTAADRVLLYDPDWNPSTDIQARERSWRLGQKRPVTIYRLITRGTIEEKVYHRQIYKHALSTRVLSDPRQRRFVSSAGVRDLFTLSDKRSEGKTTDTGQLCQRIGGDVLDRSTLPMDPAAAQSPPSSPPSNRYAHSHAANGAFAPSPLAKASPSHAHEEHEAEEGDERQTQEDGGEQDAPQEGEAKLLAELFAGAEGLHSAIDHGVLEDASAPARRDAERRAEEVAREAASAVRASREEVQRRAVHIPTWTGKAGNAGGPVPGHPPRFGKRRPSAAHDNGGDGGSSSGHLRLNSLAKAVPGTAAASPASNGASAGPSAAEVIAKFRERQASEREADEAVATGADTHASNPPRARVGPSRAVKAKPAPPAKDVSNAQDVLAQLIAYFSARRDASATSETVVGEFGTAAQSLGGSLFRHTLKQAATLDKKQGIWTLRQEFR